ncbi:DUF1269 domain-containing protein [Miniphocaeibacter halophilus]|uniref:DUF1269 domain-containing protein n=1 Tax=Miniphocaeibacter halophilus TaxID=2931922 RepID=A0AC61MSY3_9FIRM|nr:DUF1269 domain-containing protein [Miniphocaeibacter halophilus]QQK08661.1 DUF1269 domain-containing protein [Miniphocaeibacter halophilus]
MKQNVDLINFKNSEDAHEVFDKLSNNPMKDNYTINQMVIVSKSNGKIIVEDIYDSGLDTRDDMIKGGLIGGLVGILSGPIGILLFSGLGVLIGNRMDIADATKNMSLIEQVGILVNEDEEAIILLIEEEIDGIDKEIEEYDHVLTRFKASEVQYEVEEAKELEKHLERETRYKIREQRTGERKAKVKKYRERITKEFDELKEKIKKRF